MEREEIPLRHPSPELEARFKLRSLRSVGAFERPPGVKRSILTIYLCGAGQVSGQARQSHGGEQEDFQRWAGTGSGTGSGAGSGSGSGAGFPVEYHPYSGLPISPMSTPPASPLLTATTTMRSRSNSRKRREHSFSSEVKSPPYHWYHPTEPPLERGEASILGGWARRENEMANQTRLSRSRRDRLLEVCPRSPSNDDC